MPLASRTRDVGRESLLLAPPKPHTLALPRAYSWARCCFLLHLPLLKRLSKVVRRAGTYWSSNHSPECWEPCHSGQEPVALQFLDLTHHPFMGSPARPLGLGYVCFAPRLTAHALPELVRPPEASVLIAFGLALICEAMAGPAVECLSAVQHGDSAPAPGAKEPGPLAAIVAGRAVNLDILRHALPILAAGLHPEGQAQTSSKGQD